MIKKVNSKDKSIAKSILNLQKVSYEVEAKIINYFELPPLKDTVQSIQNSEEIFYGYYIDEKLCGAIAVEKEEQQLNISRLVVHPDYFRRGIAQKLINFIEANYDANKITVSTGAKNTPAIYFYEKNGFKKIKEVKINENLVIAFFEKIKG